MAQQPPGQGEVLEEIRRAATEQVVGDVRLRQVAIRTNHAAVPCGVALRR